MLQNIRINYGYIFLDENYPHKFLRAFSIDFLDSILLLYITQSGSYALSSTRDSYQYPLPK